MAKSQETYNKKEKEKLKIKKKKDKLQKKEERKANSEKGKSFEDMFAYVDAYGNISSTPPDPTQKTIVNVEDIRISISKKEEGDAIDVVRTGKVTFFNDSKGYGFIRDLESQESIFVHANSLETQIKENDKVTFEIENTPKGLSATKVKLIS